MNAPAKGIGLVSIVALIRKEIADAGEIGPQGEQGPKGEKGSQGPKGNTGPAGKQGPKGNNGKQGKPGKDGKDGEDGKDGIGIEDIRQDGDDTMVITMTDGETYEIELPKGENTEIRYQSAGGGGGSVDLSKYVEKPTTDDGWMVYKLGEGWALATTDLIETNPAVTFRDAKGRYKSTADVSDLTNQLKVNRFIANELDAQAETLAKEAEMRRTKDDSLQDQINNIQENGYDDTGIRDDLAQEIIDREQGDKTLQDQIDELAATEFPEPDLSGYLPLSGGEMEPSAEFKVNNIAPVNTPSIKYEGGESSHPMSLMNRGMISDFIDDKTDGLASVEYVDNADRILDAEIQELALALNTLLAQRDHGQWEYVGLLQDAIPRSPGQFALQDAFTSEENVLVLNSEDLKGTTHALGSVKVGDYVEVVDLEHPDDYVLYVVTDDDWGSGTLLEVSVALRESSGEIKIGDKCEVRFFAINQEDISISDLDARYLKLTGGTMTGTLKAPRVEAQKLEGGEAMMLIEGKLANNNSAARLTLSNKTNPNAYGSLTWHGQNGGGWFQFNKDLDMSNKGLHSVTRLKLTGDKVIQEGGSNRILLDSKVVITKPRDNGAGFVVKGKTNAGNNGDLLSAYHNSTGLDAVNYAGKQDAPANLANVGYVDNAIANIPEVDLSGYFPIGDWSDSEYEPHADLRAMDESYNQLYEATQKAQQITDGAQNRRLDALEANSSDFVSKSGDEMSGQLTIRKSREVALDIIGDGNQSQIKFWSSGAVALQNYTAFKNNELVTKKYVDDAVSTSQGSVKGALLSHTERLLHTSNGTNGKQFYFWNENSAPTDAMNYFRRFKWKLPSTHYLSGMAGAGNNMGFLVISNGSGSLLYQCQISKAEKSGLYIDLHLDHATHYGSSQLAYGSYFIVSLYSCLRER